MNPSYHVPQTAAEPGLTILVCIVLCCAGLGWAGLGGAGLVCAVLLIQLQMLPVALQGFLLGALSVLLVDGACRAPLLAAEPGLTTLIKLCSRLPGYSQPWQDERRTLAARTLCSCIQRDSHVRRSLITSGFQPKTVNTTISNIFGNMRHMGAS